MLKVNNVYNMNCLEGLKFLDDNSVDSIVTDPPYELGFMSKKWDSTGIAYNVEVWKECFRVLKHGGHLLSFGGTRTYHRMASAIEDAGFEIRDQIQWIYSSGFPKSHNISKGIDKKLGVEREVVGFQKGKGGENLNTLAREGKNDNPDAKGCGAYGQGAKQVTVDIPVTEPASNEAKHWDGWGTALKPAHEPIVMARKPLLEKTVVQNVLVWGTGGINIDESRVKREDGDRFEYGVTGRQQATTGQSGIYGHYDASSYTPNDLGRFPANIIFDEEAGLILDEQSGISTSAKVKNLKSGYEGESNTKFVRGVSTPDNQYDDTGGASRFFYCAKASKKDRGDGNTHPTVKPIKLMEYLIRLVTPESGIVLDPFTGSGSTLVAAKNLEFDYIGFEMEEEYIEIIEKRLVNCSTR